MFERKEFEQIDREYFQVIYQTIRHVNLKSKCTGHYWDIEDVSLTPRQRSLVLNHKHAEMDQFHIQRKVHPRNLVEAQKYIKEHDRYVLGKTKKIN